MDLRFFTKFLKRYSFFFIIVFFVSCKLPFLGPRVKTRGADNEILVVYNESEKEAVKILKKVLEEEYLTPQNEYLFKVIPIWAQDFTSYYDYKNKIILGVYKTQTQPIYQKVFHRYVGEKEYLKVARNAYVFGDFTVGIWSRRSDKLIEFVKNNVSKIKKIFEERYEELLRSKLYYVGLERWLIKDVYQGYGFTFDFPVGWKYVDIDKNFVSFAKHVPDRFLFIYREWRTRDINNIEKLLDLRDSLCKIYYDGDKVLRGEGWIKTWKVKFLGVPAVKVYGVWQNKEFVRGGPFEFYAFNYKGKFYMIDFGVFAPGQEKLPFIKRLEILVKTFRFRKYPPRIRKRKKKEKKKYGT